MAKKVLIVGGEGNGGVIAACIEDNRRRFDDDEYEVSGFINDLLPVGADINGAPVLGGTDDVHKFLDGDYWFMYAIHMIGHGPLREHISNKLAIPPERLATVVHRGAFVAPSVVMESGSFVMANSYVGPATTLGHCTLVMANCVVGHNDKIGPFNHISAGAIVSSYITTGKYTDICLGTQVIEKVTMGDYSVAGAGALVLRDVPAREVHIGRPAKFSRFIRDD